MVKLAMLLLVCVYIHGELVSFSKSNASTIMLSLMSRYPFMCSLCLDGFTYLDLVLDIMLLSFGVKDLFVIVNV